MSGGFLFVDSAEKGRPHRGRLQKTVKSLAISFVDASVGRVSFACVGRAALIAGGYNNREIIS
ncbi:MAG TPA: hypothetical protein PKE26_16765, partial [Kiritimatiellia bacterium]|nr:hypothetical protein [Kiritimatiellia bacterium]